MPYALIRLSILAPWFTDLVVPCVMAPNSMTLRYIGLPSIHVPPVEVSVVEYWDIECSHLINGINHSQINLNGLSLRCNKLQVVVSVIGIP